LPLQLAIVTTSPSTNIQKANARNANDRLIEITPCLVIDYQRNASGS